MTDSTFRDQDDAALVAAIRAGDPAPWGVVFDRHRDSIWRLAYGIVRRRADAEDVVQATFLKAVESIDQLRDPNALRFWLLSIARRRSLDIVSRGRELAYDPTDGDWAEEDHIAAPSTGAGDPLVAGLHQEDLVRLVAAAFDGLEPRDRAALELAERQELSGDELAEALDVTRDNAYQLLHNARDRFEASVTSLIVARQGRADCVELDGLLEGWDGELTPLLRKRLARHLKKCGTCSETRRLQVTPAALLSVLPLVAMSTLAVDQSRAAALEASVATAPSVAASSATGASLSAKVAVAIVVAAVVGVGVFVVAQGGSDTEVSAERLVESATPPLADDFLASELTVTLAAESTTSTTTPVLDDFCEVVAEFSAAASGGPASGSSEDLGAYLVMVDGYLQLLVASSPPTPELAAYALDYAALAKAGPAAAVQLAADDELAALRDAVEGQFNETCGEFVGD